MPEHGYAVKPRGTLQIVEAAEDFLNRVAPEHVASGEALDSEALVDVGLQSEGILVYPASVEELPTVEAETRAGENGFVEILMRDEFFDAIFEPNSQTNRARSTLAHEIGHAILHTKEVRMGRERPEEMVLRRALRSNLKPFEDSEWQAHAFAGAFLMPRPALQVCSNRDCADLAGRFGVSEGFARSHMRRIQRFL